MLAGLSPQRRPLRLKPSLLLALLSGVFAATLALAHAAASLGIPLDPFRPLGGGFFSYKAGQARYLQQIQGEQDVAGKTSTLAYARNILQNAPLSARAVWLLGVGSDVPGNLPKARMLMQLATKISRREGLAQLWLAEDALKNGDLARGMAHFDTLLRVEPELKARVLPGLSPLLAMPDGRNLLRSYGTPNSSWYPDFIAISAGVMRDATPLAEFLIDKQTYVPKDAASIEAYKVLVRKLAEANRYRELLSLYPRLPGATPERLQTLAFSNTEGQFAYPPIDWDLLQDADRGATPAATGNDSVGVEFVTAPGTVSTLARKLVAPSRSRTLTYRVVNAEGNDGSTAFWRATCAGSSAVAPVKSSDLFTADRGRTQELALPSSCPLFLIEFVMSGGMGRDQAMLFVENIQLR